MTFDNQSNTQENLLDQDTDQVVLDENKNYLEELVGENKKFKDTVALAKAKAYSDAHIALLERKLDALSEDYKTVMTEHSAGARLQDLLDKLDQKTQQLASREDNRTSNEDTKPTYSLDDIESLVSNKIQATEHQRRETENWNKVKAKLQEKLGSNFKQALKAQSDALGLSDEEVNSMARKNPNLFFKTFDLSDQKVNESFQTPPKGINTGFAPKGSEHRKWSYYRELHKKDANAWDRKTRLQMEKDSQALGAAFFDV